ncbi:hypothetical protein SOVF_105350 isoform B [Spinacia oleracea]|uniref:Uncharacterized protein isoform X1 n=1 Tax=Spinacia oleracea TaxID=3562 RepID=A0ABM3QTT3_SPIOL|nr:uncharacterized protein LOC110784964 isoform X1 [Spinacia oleracea]KNA14668.1 hypothetical protein SOVF_105350 isoform B [Spinacia oleracea]
MQQLQWRIQTTNQNQTASKSSPLELYTPDLGTRSTGAHLGINFCQGKDRYPYPVGYQALRTHKGLAYKMEIHEGSKGPLFQITSNDKQLGSGETPDRAWDNFQKKCLSRVKLWHGKRSSGKIDGVEFFGFKNALVQRLLRELVATVNDASDRSSVFTNCKEASLIGHDAGHLITQKKPDLRSCLEKPTVKGKRSRSSRGTDIKSTCNSIQGRCQSPQGNNSKVLYAAPVKTESNMELGENVSLSAHVLPVKPNGVPGDPIEEHCLIQVQSELPSMKTCAAASSQDIDMCPDGKPEEFLNVPQLDRQCIELQGVCLPVATEEGSQKIQNSPELLESRSPLLRDSQANHVGDLFAPDTFETQEEITRAPNSGSCVGEQVTIANEPVADLVISEEKRTKSHSEEGDYYWNDNSEKSDFDSVDEDITKSMMALLLPLSVPLLTYTSRKKRRKTKSVKDLSCVPKQESNLNGPISSADVISPGGILACSGSDGQIEAHLPSVSIDSDLSMMENLRYVVPDSLDTDQYVDHVTKNLPPSDNADAVPANLQEEKHEPDKKGSSPAPNTTKLSHQNETTGFKENLYYVVPESSDNDRYEDFVAKELPPFDNVEAVAANLLKEKHEPDKKMSSPVLDATESFSHQNKATGSKEILRYFLPDSLDADQCEGRVVNELPPSYNAEAVAPNLQMKHEPDEKGPRFISLPGKQQCSPANTLPKMGKCGAPLSESIICRDIQDNCIPEIHISPGNLVSANSCQDSAFGNRDNSKASFSGVGPGGPISNLQNDDVEDALAQNGVLQDQASSFTFNKNQFSDGCHFHVENSKAYINKDKIGSQNSDSVYQSPDQGRGSSQNFASHIKEDKAEIHPSCLDKQELNDEIEGNMKLIGRYSHPMRISSVMLIRKSHEIYICVSCGLLEERKRDLFLYKLSTTEPSLWRPCMIGYTSMSLPSLKDEFFREIAVDKSGLQFIPDGRGLVLADSIRMPYCREKNLHCLCPKCESCCFEENAVKIVQIKLGYISLVVKLKTIFPVHYVLVCEPDHLIAVDESGRIYVWIMNSNWSVQTEEYVIPSNDLLPSRIVELKKIPKSASMVVGHNGYGEFSLWDIINRTLVSRFSAPASSVFDFLPVSLFKWSSKGLSHDKVIMEECVRKLEEATMSWFSRHSGISIPCPMDGEDIAVWLLIFTSSESHAESAFHSRNYHLNSDGCWRLGLLIKDLVILGAALDSSTTAIDTSSGTGIIGTHGGQVYVWELATGSKLETLHDLEGNGVLHIATDDSTSSAVAIAGEGGQLCIYLRT